MFPELTAAQLRRIGSIGERRSVRKGEILFEVGEQNTRFFVVLEGGIEVVRPVAAREEPVVVHGPGSSPGRSTCSRRAAAWCGVGPWRTAVSSSSIAEHLRGLVQRDAELSEILMRAFILRRVGLLAQVDNELVLLGSPHSGATLRLKEFLTRNAQPFTYHEIRATRRCKRCSSDFMSRVDEIPVVLCQAGKVLRNPSIELLAAELGLSTQLDPQLIRDVVIVGCRPCRARGGRSTPHRRAWMCLVLEASAPGGQGGKEFAHRKLPGLSDGHLRGGARGARPARRLRSSVQ